MVTLADGVTSLTLVEVAEHCRELGLAKQKVPEQLEIVDEIPRNAMAKIQKPALQAALRPGLTQPPRTCVKVAALRAQLDARTVVARHAVTSMRTLPVAVRSSMERRATAVSARG